MLGKVRDAVNVRKLILNLSNLKEISHSCFPSVTGQMASSHRSQERRKMWYELPELWLFGNRIFDQDYDFDGAETAHTKDQPMTIA